MSDIHEGRFAQPIEQMVAGLKPGQIGGPVRSLYGYHVVKLLARHAARQLEFAQVDREQLRTDHRRKAIQDAVDGWHRCLRKDAQVVFDQAQVELLRSPPASAAKGPKARSRGTE
jgi:parvulin-like peptidyl-prolyl isomerase